MGRFVVVLHRVANGTELDGWIVKLSCNEDVPGFIKNDQFDIFADQKAAEIAVELCNKTYAHRYIAKPLSSAICKRIRASNAWKRQRVQCTYPEDGYCERM